MIEERSRHVGSRNPTEETSSLKPKPPKKRDGEVVGFLGVGLDGDGHQRITEIEHFLLVGGSQETHDRMQETAIKFSEALEKRGKRLQDTSPIEAADLLRKSAETGS